jgi:hypothetical protein
MSKRTTAGLSVAESFGELAGGAPRGRDPEREPQVWRFDLAQRPAHLEPNEILVTLVEGRTVTVRVVRQQGTRSPAVSADVLALALDAVTGFLANVTGASVGATQLTAAEEAVLASGDPAPAAAARDSVADTAIAYGRLVATSLDTAAAAKRLGVDPSRVRQLVGGSAPTLYAFKYRGTWRIPDFEFDKRALVPGLEEVVPLLPHDLHPIAVLNWFTTPHSDLVDEDETVRFSPRDWLRQGRSPAVVAALATSL